MPYQTTYEKFRDICIEQLGLDFEQVKPEAAFEDLAADSLDQIELMMAVEEEFLIDIDDEEAEAVKTVQQAVELIDSKFPTK